MTWMAIMINRTKYCNTFIQLYLAEYHTKDIQFFFKVIFAFFSTWDIADPFGQTSVELLKSSGFYKQ